MKWRLCSSGLYICITAPFLINACSSGVKLSHLLELAGVRQAAAMSTTRRGNLPVFTLSVRVAAVYRIENRLSILNRHVGADRINHARMSRMKGAASLCLAIVVTAFASP